MALLNYIAPNTYSVINNVTYNRVGMFVGFNLLIFTDSSKQVQLVEKRVEVPCYETLRQVKSLDDDDEENMAIGDVTVISSTKTLPACWPENMRGFLAEKTDNPENVWLFRYITNNEAFILKSTSAVYVKKPDGFLLNKDYSNSVTWEAFFTHTEISAPSNIVAQCYEYLKTMAGFENVVDA